jgi:hypothetical protein
MNEHANEGKEIDNFGSGEVLDQAVNEGSHQRQCRLCDTRHDALEGAE